MGNRYQACCEPKGCCSQPGAQHFGRFRYPEGRIGQKHIGFVVGRCGQGHRGARLRHRSRSAGLAAELVEDAQPTRHRRDPGDRRQASGAAQGTRQEGRHAGDHRHARRRRFRLDRRNARGRSQHHPVAAEHLRSLGERPDPRRAQSDQGRIRLHAQSMPACPADGARRQRGRSARGDGRPDFAAGAGARRLSGGGAARPRGHRDQSPRRGGAGNAPAVVVDQAPPGARQERAVRRAA